MCMYVYTIFYIFYRHLCLSFQHRNLPWVIIHTALLMSCVFVCIQNRGSHQRSLLKQQPLAVLNNDTIVDSCKDEAMDFSISIFCAICIFITFVSLPCNGIAVILNEHADSYFNIGFI